MARHYGCVRGFIYDTEQPHYEPPMTPDGRYDSAWRPCMVCGRELPKGKRKYCSPECAKVGNAKMTAKWREENPERYEESAHRNAVRAIRNGRGTP